MTPLPDKYSIFNHILHLKNKYPNDMEYGAAVRAYILKLEATRQ